MISIFNPEECASLITAFDAVEDKSDENGQTFYKNSKGVHNLPASLAYVDRLTKRIQRRYPGAKFANSYTRVYTRGSFLGIHTDRKELDITMSVCLEDRNNLEWPLFISTKTIDGEEWDNSADSSRFKEDFLGVVLPLGQGAIVEGRKYPHWRDELLCGEAQRAVYVFYHWTLEPEKPKEKDKSSVLFKSSSPKATVFGNFLNEKECTEIIAQASLKLSASQVVEDKTGESIPHENRTSWGASFMRGETPLIREIERRIAQITGIPVENGEGIQVLRYEVGQEYKPHYDFFPDEDPGSKVHTARGGQRIATFLMYLNTPEEGGATVFPDADMEVQAIGGNALLFRYDTATADTKTLHGGAPVKKGVKWVATKWLRINEF
jgi:hypothetical protein